jgi:ferredoxin-NADP reductase
MSSGYFHDRVNVGDVLQLKAPSGHFFIDPDPGVDVVLIAGGIGITPMMSMLQWCLDEQPARMVHLYYGLRHGGEHAFKQALDSLAAAHPNLHLNITYSRADAADRLGRDFQHEGHIDIALLRRTLPHGRHQFYVCGPAAMMESLVPALEDWGVARTDIHFEAFGPASVKGSSAQWIDAATRDAAGVSVQFVRSARSLVWNAADASLLDFAERHGVQVDSGCRAGSCGTCETKLLSGDILYAHKPDYDIAPGHCLLCVGVPTSAVSIEA